MLPSGHGSIAWEQTRQVGPTPDYEYDIKVAKVVGASGPVIGAPNVPSAGTAGTAVPMSASVTPADATIAWTFGDGQGASGAAVSHTYASAGSYTVTISATSGGQTTTVTRVIAVVAAPTPPTDSDGDGIADGGDCAPNDASRPAKGVEDGNCNGRDDAIELEEFRAAKEVVKEKLKSMSQTLKKSIPPTPPKPVNAGLLAKTSSYKQPISVDSPLVLNTQLTATMVGNNVVAAGGGNVIRTASGVVAAGGGNAISIAMGVVSAGGGNLTGKAATRAPKRPRQVLLGGGGATYRKAGKATLKSALNAQGKAVVKSYLAKAKALRTRGRKVAPLKIRITTIAGPIDVGSAPAVYTTRVFTITG